MLWLPDIFRGTGGFVTSAPFLAGGGAMAEAIRQYDWSATPLGPIEHWSSALKTAVGMMVNSRFPKCIFWGKELISIYNDAYKPLLGNKPEALGRPVPEVWPEIWDEIRPLSDKALAGEATFVEDMLLVVDRYGHPEHAWFTFCYSAIRDEDGVVVGVIDTVIETTGKMLTQRNARLLNAELAHRIKNTMAMISAIAGQTFRSVSSLEEAQAVFSARIAALGEAHSILTQSSWSGAPLRSVIEGALAPHRGVPGTLVIDGPPLNLSAEHALPLALAVNELATNALKYGALSVEGGKVTIGWETGAPGSSEPFRFSWVEEGGPPVVAPTRHGFGSRLIERVMAQKFAADVVLTYHASGFRYVLETTMSHVAGVDEHATEET